MRGGSEGRWGKYQCMQCMTDFIRMEHHLLASIIPRPTPSFSILYSEKADNIEKMRMGLHGNEANISLCSNVHKGTRKKDLKAKIFIQFVEPPISSMKHSIVYNYRISMPLFTMLFWRLWYVGTLRYQPLTFKELWINSGKLTNISKEWLASANNFRLTLKSF